MASASGAHSVNVNMNSFAKDKKGGGGSSGLPYWWFPEELVASEPEQKNWRGIIISLLVIVTVCGMVVLAVVLTTKDSDTNNLEDFTFDDMFDADFKAKSVTGDWIKDDSFVYRDSTTGDLILYSVSSGENRTLLTNKTIFEENISKMYVPQIENLNYLLVAQGVEYVYRHSFLASYSIYFINTKILVPLLPDDWPAGTRLQYAGWSPDGENITFVQDNNIFLTKVLANSQTLEQPPTQVTTDGLNNVIFNGIPDWVYEEEIVSDNHALWWSADGSHLVFARYDSSLVPRATIPIYDFHVYPALQEIPYPKPATNNTLVSLYFLSVAGPTTPKAFTPPADISNLEEESIISSVVWSDSGAVLVTWLNRLQNKAWLAHCTLSDSSCEVVRELDSDGWLLFESSPVFGSDRSTYFMILPSPQGGLGDFKHVAMLDTSNQDKPEESSFLTDGEFEVFEILVWQESENLLYFLSSEEGTTKRHLYNVSTVSPYKRSCVTCSISAGCQYVSVKMSQTGKNFLVNCEGPEVPESYLYISGEELVPLETNQKLKEKMKGKIMPTFKYLEVPVENADNDLGWKMSVKLIFPGEMDNAREHPLLVKVYGGPGSQSVTERFELGWPAYLTSNYYLILAYIDGRGTCCRGDQYLYSVYKNLGPPQVQDQIDGTKALQKKFSYIHNSKAAIWGWSFGGFVSSSMLGSPDNIFQCGMAVAPVTDWRYYDSIYTERYMTSPILGENEENYRDSNVSSLASNFDKKFLLVHGTADDNVHLQHSTNLAKALLQEGNQQYRLQYYTDEQHALSGDMTQKNLYRLLTDFLDDCLGL